MMTVIIDISEPYGEVEPYFKQEIIDESIQHSLNVFKDSAEKGLDAFLDMKMIGDRTDLSNLNEDDPLRDAFFKVFYRFAAELLNLFTLAMIVNDPIDPKSILGYTRRGHILKVTTCPLSSTSQTPSLPSLSNTKTESALAN